MARCSLEPRRQPVSLVRLMAKTKSAKPKLTDAERHKLFLAMAREVEAAEDPEVFDKAFKLVVTKSTAGRKRLKR